MKSLGQNIKDERKWCGLSRKKLAEMINTHPTTITKWEKNERTPPIEQIVKLIAIFDITFEELISGTDLCDKNT